MQKTIFYLIFIFILFLSSTKICFAQTNEVLDSAKFSLQKPDSIRPSKLCFLNKIKKPPILSDAYWQNKPNFLSTIKKPPILSNAYWQNKPRTATILSLALPGAGQVYNGKWWKVPIVYGLIGGMAYLYKSNIDQYESYRVEFINRDQKNTSALNPEYANLNIDAVKLYRDQYLSNAELAGFGVLLSYLMNAGDAFVDAHLKSFNINDDLSLRLRPRMQATPNNGPNVGIGLSFSFH
jgi:hypothetical protein